MFPIHNGQTEPLMHLAERSRRWSVLESGRMVLVYCSAHPACLDLSD